MKNLSKNKIQRYIIGILLLCLINIPVLQAEIQLSPLSHRPTISEKTLTEMAEILFEKFPELREKPELIVFQITNGTADSVEITENTFKDSTFYRPVYIVYIQDTTSTSPTWYEKCYFFEGFQRIHGLLTIGNRKSQLYTIPKKKKKCWSTKTVLDMHRAVSFFWSVKRKRRSNRRRKVQLLLFIFHSLLLEKSRLHKIFKL